MIPYSSHIVHFDRRNVSVVSIVIVALCRAASTQEDYASGLWASGDSKLRPQFRVAAKWNMR
jgi:hypothetical protein